MEKEKLAVPVRKKARPLFHHKMPPILIAFGLRFEADGTIFSKRATFAGHSVLVFGVSVFLGLGMASVLWMYIFGVGTL